MNYAYSQPATANENNILKCECNHTGMYELLELIEAAIASAAPDKRNALSETINAYMNDFREEYFWAVGPQFPTLLHHISAKQRLQPMSAARRTN